MEKHLIMYYYNLSTLLFAFENYLNNFRHIGKKKEKEFNL